LQRVGGAKKIEKSKKIQKLEKLKSPKVPQARPIENFSGYLC
jgi:hypothetical protein